MNDEIVKAAEEVLAAYCALPGNSTGGAVHIVSDDFNYADSHVQWCIEQAEADGDEAGAAVARMLLALPRPERALACVPMRCKNCGHSTSLHHRDHPSGRYGYSSEGPCRVPECPCQDVPR